MKMCSKMERVRLLGSIKTRYDNGYRRKCALIKTLTATPTKNALFAWKQSPNDLHLSSLTGKHHQPLSYRHLTTKCTAQKFYNRHPRRYLRQTFNPWWNLLALRELSFSKIYPSEVLVSSTISVRPTGRFQKTTYHRIKTTEGKCISKNQTLFT